MLSRIAHMTFLAVLTREMNVRKFIVRIVCHLLESIL